MKTEKRPGWDWRVHYRMADEPETEMLEVYGAMTIEQALQDARSSIMAGEALGVDCAHDILSIERIEK